MMAVNTRHLGRHHVVEVSFVRIRTRSENQELTGHLKLGDSIKNLNTEKQRKRRRSQVQLSAAKVMNEHLRPEK